MRQLASGHWVCPTIFGVLLSPGTAWSQTTASGPNLYSFSNQLLFWIGAVAIVALLARVVFKEQLHERKTLHRLVDEIGPYFPEFDIDAIKYWVSRCAPHVWNGWQTGNMSGLTDFATADFLSAEAMSSDSELKAGRVRQAALDSVLKVHPLGLYMVGEGPAPRDVELMLRLEIKCVDYMVDRDKLHLENPRQPWQIQYFWTIRHDGTKWRLHRVWPATEDVTDLADRRQIPLVTEWVQRKLDADHEVPG